MKKIYYNITRIDNGWLISLPKYYANLHIQSGTAEMSFPSLEVVLAYIKDHYDGLIFNNELGNVDAEITEAEITAKNSL